MDSAESTPPVPHQTTDWPWKIPLRARNGTVRAWTLVDEAAYEWLMQWPWHLNKRYVARNIPAGTRRQRPLFLHRLLLGLELGDRRQGDHWNLDKLDNRRSNLRVATKAQNMQNVGANRGARSPYRGVSLIPSGKWQAEVQINHQRFYLGVFESETEAAAVASDFRREHMPYAVER